MVNEDRRDVRENRDDRDRRKGDKDRERDRDNKDRDRERDMKERDRDRGRGASLNDGNYYNPFVKLHIFLCVSLPCIFPFSNTPLKTKKPENVTVIEEIAKGNDPAVALVAVLVAVNADKEDVDLDPGKQNALYTLQTSNFTFVLLQISQRTSRTQGRSEDRARRERT